MIKYRDILIKVFGEPIEELEESFRTKDWYVKYSKSINVWFISKYNYFKYDIYGTFGNINPITNITIENKDPSIKDNPKDLIYIFKQYKKKHNQYIKDNGYVKQLNKFKIKYVSKFPEYFKESD